MGILWIWFVVCTLMTDLSKTCCIRCICIYWDCEMFAFSHIHINQIKSTLFLNKAQSLWNVHQNLPAPSFVTLFLTALVHLLSSIDLSHLLCYSLEWNSVNFQQLKFLGKDFVKWNFSISILLAIFRIKCTASDAS